MNQASNKGQIAIILLLITLVALSVGLAITQRSLTNLSTSTQNEQSSRAFSAADAGIERAVQQDTSISSFAVGTDSTAAVTKNVLPNTQQALEYPPIGKETIAQFWLANPDNITDATYNNTSVDVYFGRSDIAPTVTDAPGIEINAIVLDTTTNTYSSTRTYIDSSSLPGRYPSNGFNSLSSPGCSVYTINTSSSADTSTLDRPFRCRHTLTITNGAANLKPVMLRIRLLYSTLNHPIAVKPTGVKSLPPQASLFISKGTSGQSQKTLQVFRLKYVVPNFFEFSIFSAGDIRKQNL